MSRLLLFLLLNFGALALGGLFTSSGVTSDWYANLQKAPWTPPGWVFGFAWTSIMVCYSFFLSRMWTMDENKGKFMLLFGMQWLLNVGWNPLFFYYHLTFLSMLEIASLTLLIGFTLFNYRSKLGFFSLLLLPYFLWLLIASSLNGYIVVFN